MKHAKTVLVTGSAGRIGRAVAAELSARGHRVIGFDRVPGSRYSPSLKEAVAGDLTKLSEVERAMKGVDEVVHLAATPDEDDFLSKLLPNNVIALFHVLEQARLASVKRVILASTCQVVRGHAGPWPITPEMPATPRNWYASTKIFAEAAGQSYAYLHDLSVIVVRCGWCPRTRRDLAELSKSDFDRDVYLSPADAGRCFACAVEASPDLRFAVVFATSLPVKELRYDLRPARELLGYEPRDCWPQGIEIVTEP